MKTFLLKRYLESGADPAEHRGVFAISLALAIVLPTAWLMPERAVWVATISILFAAIAIPQRSSALEATLPIAGRDIAWARLIVGLLAGLLPLAVVVPIILWRGKSPLAVVETLQAIATIVLGVIMPRLVKPEEFSVKRVLSVITLAVMGSLVAVSIRYLSDVVTLTWLVAATAVAGGVWWRSVPNTYQAASLIARRERASDRKRVSSDGARWWWMVGRSLFTPQRLMFSAVLLLNASLGGWWYGFLMLATDDILQHIGWIQAMPMSHRQRLSLVLLPTVVLSVVLVMVGPHIHIPGLHYNRNLRSGAPGTYKQESGYFDSPTSISLEYWTKATNGAVPIITAPWGETVKPYTVRIFNTVFYNSYSARPSSSREFTDLQFSRLTRAVYGFPVSRQNYNAQAVQPPRQTESARMVILHIGIGVCAMLAYMIVVGIAKMRRFWSRIYSMVIATSVAIIIPLGFAFYILVKYGEPQDMTDIVLPLIDWHLLRLSAALPSNLVAVICLAALPVYALYALLEWQFTRWEVVGALSEMDVR